MSLLSPDTLMQNIVTSSGQGANYYCLGNKIQAASLLGAFLTEVTFLEDNHEELRIRSDENLMRVGSDPEECHLVGGVEVPDHSLGCCCQGGHQALVLGSRGVVHRGLDGDTLRAVEHHSDDPAVVLHTSSPSGSVLKTQLCHLNPPDNLIHGS